MFKERKYSNSSYLHLLITIGLGLFIISIYSFVSVGMQAEFYIDGGKRAFQVSEKITFTLQNITDQPILLENRDPWLIRKNGQVVFQPSSPGVITEIKPGELSSWTWSQKDQLGNQVNPGTYLIELHTLNAGIHREIFHVTGLGGGRGAIYAQVFKDGTPISGTIVVVAREESPLRKIINMEDPPSEVFSGRTDRDGGAVITGFQGLEPGKYMISAFRKTSKSILSTPIKEVEVKAEEITNITLSLNKQPQAKITVLSDRFGIVGERLRFSAIGSKDPDGTILNFKWNFGDETTSQGKEVTHRYKKPGTYFVKLTVTDDEGAQASRMCEVKINKQPIAKREFSTFTVLSGEWFRVKIRITPNRTLKEVEIIEKLPNGWKVRSLEQSGVSFIPAETRWKWDKALLTKETVTLSYDVKIPVDTQTKSFSLKGSIRTLSLMQPLSGDNEIQVREFLPILTVISHWDAERNELDLRLPNIITYRQFLQAVAWWKQGEPVPRTKGKVISNRLIKEMRNLWLTERPVF